MKLFPRLALPAALIALAAFVAPVHARPPVPVSHPAPAQRVKFDPKKFWRVSELRPGMKGYALTVFKGTRIDRFGIEILGVAPKFNEGKDYILFRATSGPPVTRGLNIAHGMSGSPIYIGGRLVGAISMGLPFAKDPIGLATPIEDMLDAWSPDLPSKPSSGSATLDSGGGMTAVGSFAPGAFDPRMLTAGAQFRPLDVPVAVSGLSPRGAARFASVLAPYGLSVLATGGGAGGDDNPLAKGAKLVPGAAVGVSLVQGDIDLTAIGTVTYRDGDRVLIFGHPFTDFGPIDAALTTAYVVDVFPSFQDSIKFGSPIKTVGRVFQDRPFSVGGVLGSQPQMVPVTVNINDESIRKKQTFKMRVFNHPLLTGTLVTQLVDSAISLVHGLPGDSVATVTMDADVEEIGHVRRTNTFYDAVAIDQAATADIDDLMHTLSANSFYPLALRSMTVGVTIQTRHDTAQVDHIFLRQGKYAPGDTVNVGVVLKPFKRETIVRTMAVKIPLSTPSGTLTLSVRGGGTDGGGGISLGGGLILLAPSGPSSSSPAGSVGQLVKQLLEKPRNNELVARLLLPTSAINIQGEKLSGLPPTLAAAMQNARTSGLKTERDDVKVIQSTPYIVSGSGSLSIVVQKKSVGENTPATAPSSPDASSPSDTSPSASDGSDSSTDSGSTDGPTAVSVVGGAWPAETLAAAPPPPSAASAAPAVSVTTATVSVSSVSPSSPAPSSSTPRGSTTPQNPVKTVGRLAQIWRQGTTADFTAGTLKNVTVTSAGDVRLAASLQKVGETGESYLWALLPDGKGGLYAGTGDRGMIYHMGTDGKKTPFFDTKELEVTSLAQDKDGNVYAGTAPHGIVFVVPPDGKGRKLMTAQEKYVTALCVDDTRHSLYAGTGGGTGRVYQFLLPPTGRVAPITLFTSPEAHILSLAVGKDGTVYAGSAPDGIVYAITSDGVSRVLYDAPEANISALAADDAGNVYAGTAPRGNVYKISADSPVKTLLTGTSPGIAALRIGANATLYACAGGTVYQIGSDEVTQSFVAPTDEQFLTLAVGGGPVYAGAAVGTVYQIASGGATSPLSGTFQSVVHDAGLSAHWGTLAWTSITPAGTHVALQTRTGDTERPDESWSAWSAPSEEGAGRAIQSPPGRYFQYQATLTGSAGDSIPRLQSVTAYYLPRNQAPTVRLLAPREGDALSKTATLRWTAGDPDKDTLSYDLSYSADGGTTWVPLKKKTVTASAVSTASAATPPASTVTDAQVAAKVQQMRAGLDNHPEIPAAVRQQILAQAPTLIRQAAARASTAPNTSSAGLRETSYTWDTTRIPDGSYQVQIVASDAPSNPQGALTAKAVSATFLVDNTPPTITTSVPVVGKDKSVTVTGTATAGPAFVKAVQAKVDGGDLLAASATDGLFDGTSEQWTLQTTPLTSGSHTLDIQVLDGAGNTGSTKVTVSVP